MNASELANAAEKLRSLTDQAERRRARRAELWQRLESLTVTEVGARGALRVTVGSGGELINLELAEQARALPAQQLSAQVMAAIRRAQAALAQQVAAAAGQADDPVSA